VSARDPMRADPEKEIRLLENDCGENLMASRKGYDFEKCLENPRFEVWNASSFKLICLVCLGRDAAGIDLGYDDMGLKNPPTDEERGLALRILKMAIGKVVKYPEPALKQLCKDVRDFCEKRPGGDATNEEIKELFKILG
jgi:hypothetical protein